MSFATCSAEAFCVPAFCLIFAPFKGYDEPEILPSQLSRFCLIGADAGHDAVKLPLVRHAFEAVDSEVIELESRAGDQVFNRSRDKNTSRWCSVNDPRGD